MEDRQPTEPVAEQPEADEPQAAPFPSLPTRILDTFVSPGKMATYVAETPKASAALLLVVIIVALSTALIPAEMFAETQRQAALEAGRDFQEMPEQAIRIIRIVTPILAALSVVIFTALFAAIYTFVFVFVLGDEGRYRQYFAILAHSSIVSTFIGLLLTPLRISSGNAQLTVNLGSFFGFLGDGYLLGVLTALDLSQIWASLIMAIGVTKIDPRRSFGSAATILLGFVLVLALIFGRFL